METILNKRYTTTYYPSFCLVLSGSGGRMVLYSGVVSFVLLLLFIPMMVHAQVLITEIMYAPKGPDAKHEWIEVCNFGSTSTDITQWRFYENKTKHKLSLLSGNAALAPKECGIIANDAITFATTHAGFSATLFDSTFSLKNTGEIISLEDDKGIVMDTVSYTDANGAKDDGNSLHRLGSLLTAGVPTPGVFSSTSGTVSQTSGPPSKTSVTVSTKPTTVYTYNSVTIQPPEAIHIRTRENIVAIAGAPVSFNIESIDATGTVSKGGTIHWSFGDGGEALGRTVKHTFVYPGTYIAQVHLSKESLSSQQQIQVTIFPLTAKLTIDPKGKWIGISNNSKNELDLSLWRLVAGWQYFSIPIDTIIQAKGSVKFANKVTKLQGLRAMNDVHLVYPDGTLALVAAVATTTIRSVAKTSTSSVPTIKSSIPLSQAKAYTHHISIAKIPKVSAAHFPVKRKNKTRISIASVSTKSDVYTKNNTQSPSALSRTATIQKQSTTTLGAENQQAAVVLGLGTKHQIPLFYWYLALAVLLIFSGGTLFYLRSRTLVVDGFEVIDGDV